MSHNIDPNTLKKFRSFIGDRALWFALLYREFSKILPKDQVEEASRKAIYEYGQIKAKRDGEAFEPKDLMRNFEECGAAQIFDAVVTDTPEGMLNRVGNCALVDAWKELGCSPEECDLFCDIAMEGDRGRAEGHGINLELRETLGKGDDHCWIRLS